MSDEQRDHLQLAYNGLCGVIQNLKLANCLHFSARAHELLADISNYPEPGRGPFDSVREGR